MARSSISAGAVGSRYSSEAQKTVTEIVTDIVTWVPKLTLLTLSGHVESTTYVLSMSGECIRLTGLPAIKFCCTPLLVLSPKYLPLFCNVRAIVSLQTFAPNEFLLVRAPVLSRLYAD